ncbi:hypothetical protein [Paludisphaera rhizosphaerae]|uniref:hypothetical protein n=1 Tax=Paludisphaera rhizosphaerae TaxID=2711216 RepID=UPI0013E9F577|nr:hypothetical protein [Paludisphaera rhizosphaerae]
MRAERVGMRAAFTTALIVASLMVVDRSVAQDAYFPPLIFAPKVEGLNNLIDELTTINLRALKEPSLWKLSRENRTVVSYRFLWIAANEHPMSLRLTRSGDDVVLNVKSHDKPPQATEARLRLDKELKLKFDEGRRIVDSLEKTKFWKAPVSVKEGRGIGDGDVIVIEGVRNGEYHVIDRAGCTTGESYKAFCRAILNAAGEPNALKTWERIRQAERKSPDYVAEPSETEDLGD